MMVPDSFARFKSSLDDLEAFVDKNGEDLEVESKSVEEATKWLEQAKAIISKEREEGIRNESDYHIHKTNVDDLKEGEVF